MNDNPLDVIDVEVFRKSLENITSEMAITLMRASGSSVVTDTRDFCTAMFDANAEQLAFSGWVTMHAAASVMGVQATVALYGDDPTLAPGDAFIVSDPYTGGALHQADVGIVMPHFHDGRLVGWSFCAEHVLDVGGVAVGGSAPSAHDVWSEALRFPPTRIVVDGVIDPGWERFIASSVRVPDAVINDLRSMVAACNTAQRKLEEMIGRYGLDEFERRSEVVKALSEQALREKIIELPDGEYVADEWIEFDAHATEVLLQVTCALEIDGDRMRIVLSGDPQIDALVNGAHGGVAGSIASALLCMLTYDIPMNQGVWRHLEFDYGPSGTVVNPEPPAPVSQSHMGCGFRIGKAFVDVLAQACALSGSEELQGRVAGAPNNSVPSALLFGMNQFDRPTVSVLLATAIGVGGGAQTVADGQDCYAAQSMQGCRMPDVEVFEGQEPGLILYRRLDANSGGAGARSGGLGMEEATVVRAPAGMTGVVYSHCDRVPPRGFAGGLPGGADRISLSRGTGVLGLMEGGTYPSTDLLEGGVERWASIADVVLVEGDVVIMTGGGGGGLGDPLLRDPVLVARDVAEERVTADHATVVYGVVLDASGGLDETATRTRRDGIRDERLRAAGGDPDARVELGADAPPFVSVVAADDDRWSCARCAHDLGPRDENWRETALGRERGVVEAAQERSQRIRPRVDGPAVVERDAVCPGCGSLLAADIAVEGGPPAAAPRRRAHEAASVA